TFMQSSIRRADMVHATEPLIVAGSRPDGNPDRGREARSAHGDAHPKESPGGRPGRVCYRVISPEESEMKFRIIVTMVVALGVAAGVGQTLTWRATAQQPPPRPAPAGGGLFGTAEQQAKQAAIEKSTPQLKVTEEILRLIV